MLTSGHIVYDNRIYYKEILSLKKNYNKIYLIAPGDKDFVTEDGIIVKTFKKRKNSFDRFRPMRDLRRLALEVDADVYHAHEPDSLQVAISVKKKTGAKVIYDSHEYYPEAFSEHFKIFKSFLKKILYHYEKFFAKKADYIITVNKLLKEKFKKYNDNVEILRNYPVISTHSTEKSYGNKPVFIYVGGLREDRGILKILEAIKMVNDNSKYIFVGAFDNKKFEQKVHDYVASELKNFDITFTGKIPHVDVFNYLKEADAGFVLLQPNNWRYVHSEPIKLFEYMMSKTAVIGSDFKMIDNIVENSNCGITIDPDNVSEIAHAIEAVKNNRNKISDMGQNGENAVIEYYNWSQMEPKLLSIYAQL